MKTKECSGQLRLLYSRALELPLARILRIWVPSPEEMVAVVLDFKMVDGKPAHDFWFYNFAIQDSPVAKIVNAGEYALYFSMDSKRGYRKPWDEGELFGAFAAAYESMLKLVNSQEDADLLQHQAEK